MMQITCKQKDHKEMNCEWVCLEKDCQVSRFLCKYCILWQQKKNSHKNNKLIYQQQQVEPEIENVKNLYNEIKQQIDYLIQFNKQIQGLIQRLDLIIQQSQTIIESLKYFNIQSTDDYKNILNFFSNNLENGNLNYDCMELNHIKSISKFTKQFPLNDIKNQMEQLIDYLNSNSIGIENKPKIKIISIQKEYNEYNDLLSTQSGEIDNNFKNRIKIQDITDYIEQKQNQKLYQFDDYNNTENFSMDEMTSQCLNKSR
ncbi:hypothetical protein pb186bvf_000595 [Paramecium bursaria]